MKKMTCIHIGGLYASKEPAVIETLLGSCVAVCLFDPVEQIGGMNHILLPGKADLKHYDVVSRYGINAMELLINKLMNLGSKRYPLVAKVFGGAHVLPAISHENGMGRKNVEFVLEFLHMETIPITSRDTGGCRARKIYFHTDTGEVLLKRIHPTHHAEVGLRERNFVDRVVRMKAEEPGEITMFT